MDQRLIQPVQRKPVVKNKLKSMKADIPFWEKANLTIKEAAAYSNIGEHSLRELIIESNSCFAFKVGNKQLINRSLFDQYIARACEQNLAISALTGDADDEENY